MALTVRQDGQYVGGQPNNATAAWWNDYYNLLTGAMTDQDITPKTDLILQPLSGNPLAPSLALAAGTALGIGIYGYAITFVKHGQSGETTGGAGASITTTSGNQAVSITNIPTGPTGTIARNIYRSKVGGGTLYFVAQLNNNTATTYSDTTPDASLGAAIPNNNSFGGRLIIKDASGNTNVWFTSNGAGSVSGNFSVGGQVNSTVVGTTGSAFYWNGSAGSVGVAVLGIYPVDAGQKHWQIIYNGGDQHLQIQNATDGLDVLDFAPNGTVSTNYGQNTSGILGQITSNGGGAAGARIWVGTTDPGALAGEGDIWIKA